MVDVAVGRSLPYEESQEPHIDVGQEQFALSPSSPCANCHHCSSVPASRRRVTHSQPILLVVSSIGGWRELAEPHPVFRSYGDNNGRSEIVRPELPPFDSGGARDPRLTKQRYDDIENDRIEVALGRYAMVLKHFN